MGSEEVDWTADWTAIYTNSNRTVILRDIAMNHTVSLDITKLTQKMQRVKICNTYSKWCYHAHDITNSC